MQQAQNVLPVRMSLVCRCWWRNQSIFLSLLYKAADLKNNVTCVDFSKDMLESEGKLKGVDAVCQDCVDFAAGVQVNSFDMFLIKEIIHSLLVTHLNTFYSNLHQGL